MVTFFVLRYLPGTPIELRKHTPTLGRFPTWLDAETERANRPLAGHLEVLERQEARRS